MKKYLYVDIVAQVFAIRVLYNRINEVIRD